MRVGGGVVTTAVAQSAQLQATAGIDRTSVWLETTLEAVGWLACWPKSWVQHVLANMEAVFGVRRSHE